MTKEERENDCFGKLIKKDIPPMSTEQAIEVLHELDGSLYETQQVALDMAINALEIVEEFEKAQIITGGRLNGRTYAYKCGLEDGKRKALEQQPCDDCISRQAVLDLAVDYSTNSATFLISVNSVKALPPVAPAHGTCKDCKNGFQTSFCSSSVYGCEKHKGVYQYDFYCKDFEKRGNENGSN